ncbi:hypothetical protein [Marinigracilibium pacificum]|uniref:Uncharacterized protein n=1 Tax=Marinigracilibium pacificum TaxID=2729599 RepID=A0A848IVV3_9BACT|nr:hypothetical protein [Marinigracilibium pacificum]NMM47308.1 hypothetical protein [Marinigracilibium pacificum]
MKYRHLIIATLIGFLLLSGYELYFRSQGEYPHVDDTEDLWAEQRAKLDDLDERDVVIIGSSRAHQDINLQLWDSLTGRKPLQLALPGSCPYPILEDIVDNSGFNGLLIIGVAPGLFFLPKEHPWAKGVIGKSVGYYEKQTYAQKLNHIIYKPFDKSLAYINVEDYSFESLIDGVQFANRDSVEGPIEWPRMIDIDEFRDSRMTDQFEIDTVLQNQQKAIWSKFDREEHYNYDSTREQVIKQYVDKIEIFKKRGGRVAFIRPTVSGVYLEEMKRMPREKYWNELLKETGCVGYHFEDYEEIKDFEPPEWSHFSKKQQRIFTNMLVRELKKDSLIKD